MKEAIQCLQNVILARRSCTFVSCGLGEISHATRVLEAFTPTHLRACFAGERPVLFEIEHAVEVVLDAARAGLQTKNRPANLHPRGGFDTSAPTWGPLGPFTQRRSQRESSARPLGVQTRTARHENLGFGLDFGART